MATKLWTGASTGVLSTAGNWSPSGVPVAGDNVIFAPGYTTAPSSGLTALNAATLGGSLGYVRFAEGWDSGMATTRASNFQFTCTRLDFWGSATIYIDLEASAIAPQITNTASANPGSVGLYLKGSALSTMVVQGNSTVGVAYNGGETSTVSEARCAGSGAKLYLGSGVSLTTAYAMDGGTIYQNCASTTTKARDGNVTTDEVGAITTLTVYGNSQIYPNSTGTITTMNVEDSTSKVDFSQSPEARTVTTLNWKKGKVKYDPAVVTVSTLAVGLTGRVNDLTAA